MKSLILIATAAALLWGCSEDSPSDEAASAEGATAGQLGALSLDSVLSPTAQAGMWFELSDAVRSEVEPTWRIPLYLANRGPVAGFQFSVTGGTIVSAEGGQAGERGFQVLAHENGNVLGVSFDGAVIEPGARPVTYLVVEATAREVCFEGLIIGGPNGESLSLESSTISCIPVQ